MNILVYEPINQISTLIVNSLIQNGFKVLSLTNSSEISYKLSQSKFEVLVYDCAADDEKSIQLIRELIANRQGDLPRVILHMRNPNKQIILEMVKSGIIGVILKPFDPNEFIKRFLDIVNKTQQGDSAKRSHIRIDPNPKDEASVTVRSPKNFKLISGKIVNISVGGVLFAPFGNELADELELKQIIKSVQIKFRLNTIEATVMVVGKKDNMIAIKFVKMEEYDKNVLCKYIYEYLVSENMYDGEGE